MRLLLALWLLAAHPPVAAQFLSAEITPNPAIPMPQMITITITEATGTGVVLPLDAATGAPCIVASIHLGGPGGPIDPCNGPYPVCVQPGALLGPCASMSESVPVNCIAPGDRWLRVAFDDLAGNPHEQWFAFTITYGAFYSPTLTTSGPAQLGQSFTMTLGSDPLVPYVVAASLSTNVGIPVPALGITLSLDNDVAFQLSLSPPPAFFTNFSGNLDATGTSPPIVLALPNLPFLDCSPFHFQGVVDFFGTPRTTNVVNLTLTL